MSTGRPTPPVSVPTLTEVVQWPGGEPPAVTGAAPPPPTPSEDELVRRVIADLQLQIDLMLDVRLKEALAPILTRATDTLMRDVRNQLASTLRDVVTRAVAKELGRPTGK